MDNEQSLIRRAQKGDQDAFAVLVDEHQRYIYNLTFRVLKDENEALDLTQETFARGFPGGAAGVYQAVEATIQLRGRAEANQVPNAKTALIQSLGGPASTAVSHILQRI